jgi:murein DD-endopeptidase MepM/ murein hydrolase activator NlpD
MSGLVSGQKTGNYLADLISGKTEPQQQLQSQIVEQTNRARQALDLMLDPNRSHSGPNIKTPTAEDDSPAGVPYTPPKRPTSGLDLLRGNLIDKLIGIGELKADTIGPAQKSRVYPGEFGKPVPGNPQWGLHSGEDYAAETGTPVYAPESGMAYRDGSGQITLRGNSGISSQYAHLSKVNLPQKPLYITRGQLLGNTGDKGVEGSWNPHLHFQAYVPKKLRRKDDEFVSGYVNNPTPYVNPYRYLPK